MSTCTEGCLHPGRPTPKALNCEKCGRFSNHSWAWETYGPDGFYATWGGTCSVHGDWSEST